MVEGSVGHWRRNEAGRDLYAEVTKGQVGTVRSIGPPDSDFDLAC